MKKILLVITIIVLIAFFYPKERFFGCGGPVCLKENVGKGTEKEKNTLCIGFEEKIPVDDAIGKRCYGIFLTNKK